jgi:Txe/YoeB family toxin of Txe-Axe toxin-antitoxin module
MRQELQYPVVLINMNSFPFTDLSLLASVTEVANLLFFNLQKSEVKEISLDLQKILKRELPAISATKKNIPKKLEEEFKNYWSKKIKKSNNVMLHEFLFKYIKILKNDFLRGEKNANKISNCMAKIVQRCKVNMQEDFALIFLAIEEYALYYNGRFSLYLDVMEVFSNIDDEWFDLLYVEIDREYDVPLLEMLAMKLKPIDPSVDLIYYLRRTFEYEDYVKIRFLFQKMAFDVGGICKDDFDDLVSPY